MVQIYSKEWNVFCSLTGHRVFQRNVHFCISMTFHHSAFHHTISEWVAWSVCKAEVIAKIFHSALSYSSQVIKCTTSRCLWLCDLRLDRYLATPVIWWSWWVANGSTKSTNVEKYAKLYQASFLEVMVCRCSSTALWRKKKLKVGMHDFVL